jgi:uncharacterized membrane protein SpoIIM required for sporulation
MTPLQFEHLHAKAWAELESSLTALRNGGRRRQETKIAGDRVAELYRRACGHLALARARAYPAYLVERLEHMTADAYQLIYQRHELGFQRMRHLLAHEFPQTVRAQQKYVWVAAAVLMVPSLILGFLVYWRPELILSLVDAGTVADFETMYAKDTEAVGRTRSAQTDWSMFGHYVQNNISVAFQCFAGGLLGGIGSVFYLAYNGAFIGGIAGYVTERGLGGTFYSFVATHSAFELTAIVLSGAAGMCIGHAVLAPGRYTRVQALVTAARKAIVIIYGTTLLLVVAAGVEAFWSSSSAIANWVKYAAAGVSWAAVIAYLSLQGRSES